jgi:DNA polymerase-4
MSRRIIHLDLDAFYCAVEEQLDPTLKGKPFAVGGKPQHRGVVSSCSYAARHYGVRSAMPTTRAAQLCPDIILLPGNRKEYSKKSREVMSILSDFSDNIEQISIDEAFLDVSGINKEDTILAKEIQNKIMEKTGLPCSLGIASNKLVAKIATDVGKSANKTMDYPMAIQIVIPGNEAAFLAPLPTRMLWGVGKQTAKILDDLGIHTIGDLAKWPEKDLIQRFGQHGKDLHLRSQGIDQQKVMTHSEAKSYSQEVTFSKDVSDEKIIHEQIVMQSGSIAESLREGKLLGRVVKIKLRWPDFTTMNKQVTLPSPTNDEKVIAEEAMKLLDQSWKNKHPIRMIGVGVSGLGLPNKQMGLWDQVNQVNNEKLDRLETVIHKVKKKYGDSSIYFGGEKKEKPITR